MLKPIIAALAIALSAPALAHSDSKFTKGPNGGHLVDAGGGAQHWELVASGGELTLYVTDPEEKPIDTAGGTASAQVLAGGQKADVALSPAGGNILKGSGGFTAVKGMKVILKTQMVGGASYQARFTPLQ